MKDTSLDKCNRIYNEILLNKRIGRSTILFPNIITYDIPVTLCQSCQQSFLLLPQKPPVLVAIPPSYLIFIEMSESENTQS